MTLGVRVWFVLFGALALSRPARAEEIEVLVAPFQPETLASKGISNLLHAYLEGVIDDHPELAVVPVSRAGMVFDQKAALYLDSCPPSEQVGCALVVAEAAQVPWAVTGTVLATDEGADVHIWVLDVERLRQVDFEWPLRGDDDALARETEARLLAVIRGEEGAPVDERFRREPPSEEEEALAAQREQDAAELERQGSQVTRLGEKKEGELLRDRMTEDELLDEMEGEGSKPWERLEMSPRQYLRYKNSGMPLFEWRERAAGRKAQLLIRPTLGLVRGPSDGAYYGRYVRSASTLAVVQSYAWQAPITGSGPTLGLQVGYGILPTLEIGLVGGASIGIFEADIAAVTEGDPVRERDPQTYSAWSTYGGLQILGAPLPTASVRPVIGGQALIWRGTAVDDHVMPPSELMVFPAPLLGIVGAVAGVEARLGPRIDAYAHVPVQAVIFGGDPGVQDDGGDYLEGPEEPPTLGTVGAGLLLGVQIRALGPREEKRTLEDYEG